MREKRSRVCEDGPWRQGAPFRLASCTLRHARQLCGSYKWRQQTAIAGQCSDKQRQCAAIIGGRMLLQIEAACSHKRTPHTAIHGGSVQP
eukprot:3704392-Rhodomonas_salina.1